MAVRKQSNRMRNQIRMDYKGAKEWILSCLDTQLSDKLYYHGKHHTLDVLHTTKELCQAENVNSYHTTLLKTAALLHDIGFTRNSKEHESIGCNITREILPKYGYTSGEIEAICGMIMATKIPQSPKTKYEEIICDADLDYLGREDFYSIGDSLFKELVEYNSLQDVRTWNRIQVSFLGKHSYFTRTNKERRQPKKQAFLNDLIELVATY
jgi:uncharacterized protein